MLRHQQADGRGLHIQRHSVLPIERLVTINTFRGIFQTVSSRVTAGRQTYYSALQLTLINKQRLDVISANCASLQQASNSTATALTVQMSRGHAHSLQSTMVITHTTTLLTQCTEVCTIYTIYSDDLPTRHKMCLSSN